MKRSGILNPVLAQALAKVGHGHEIVIADPGLPLPLRGPEVVHLTLVLGVPAFKDVLEVLVDELVIEGSVLAEEAVGGPVHRWAHDAGLEPETVSHEALKERLEHVRLIVRTGEPTPYANLLLRCGVAF